MRMAQVLPLTMILKTMILGRLLTPWHVLPKGPMVAEPDSVKLIRILQTGTEFVVVLKLGDDSDVMARTLTHSMRLNTTPMCVRQS